MDTVLTRKKTFPCLTTFVGLTNNDCPLSVAKVKVALFYSRKTSYMEKAFLDGWAQTICDFVPYQQSALVSFNH